MVEQDHRFVKHHVHPVLGLGVFNTVQRTIQGYDAIYMFHKGQVEGTGKENAVAQSLLLTSCSGWQHKEPLSRLALCSNSIFTTLQQISSLGRMGRRKRCRSRDGTWV
jgi:hypothetical protein